MKFQKKIGGGGSGPGGGGQGRCERRSEVFVKIQKIKLGGGKVRSGWGSGWGGGGQGRCEQRSEVFVKIQKKKKNPGGGVGLGGGVRMDVNEELKFLC